MLHSHSPHAAEIKIGNHMHFKIKVPNANASETVLSVTSPYDGSVIGTLETINLAGAKQALINASSLFNNKKSWLSAAQRIEILKKTAELMQQRFDELVQIALSEGGKPLQDTRIEMNRAIDGVLNCVDLIKNEHGTEIPMQLNTASANRVAFTRKTPRGVVLAFSAFNHPINLIVHQVAPAIATGCPVIVKPASDTALSAFAFCELLEEAGLPEGWCQPIAVEDLKVASSMVEDKRVGFFSFIGSGRVGWMLKSKLSAGTHCSLEHGGAAPVIVAKDADIDDMLPLLAKGGFYHAGQVCVSVQRVFVHESLFDQVSQGLVDYAQKMKSGNPADESTEIGPLIRHAEVDRIEEWVNEAISEKAILATGGKRNGNAFYEPTVLLNPDKNSKVSQQEIFGPVICVYSYTDMDKAIKQANNVPFSFQASIFTKNIDTALRGWQNLEATAVMINDHTAFRVDWMPFGGEKESGYGMGGIPFTYRDMQIEKMAVIRSPALKF